MPLANDGLPRSAWGNSPGLALHFQVAPVELDAQMHWLPGPDDDSRPVPDGIEAQTHKVLDNLKRALAGAGASLADVVCVRIFLTDFERDYAAMNRIYATYFPKGRLPARTTIGVTALARGGIVEIDFIARRSAAKRAKPPAKKTQSKRRRPKR